MVIKCTDVWRRKKRAEEGGRAVKYMSELHENVNGDRSMKLMEKFNGTIRKGSARRKKKKIHQTKKQSFFEWKIEWKM